LPKDLQPVTCSEKVIISFAGPLANVLLAMVLTIIVYFIGLPVGEENMTTEVGYVTKTVKLQDGTETKSPAYLAGILPKDKILTIDGSKVKNFRDIEQFIAFGNKKDENDNPSSIIEIERNGEKLKLR
jgi:membrane-associated protease RseP (regulator of RpoE activity)